MKKKRKVELSELRLSAQVLSAKLPLDGFCLCLAVYIVASANAVHSIFRGDYIHFFNKCSKKFFLFRFSWCLLKIGDLVAMTLIFLVL